MITIEHRKQQLVNTDPQRRCYYGVHAKSELQWTGWAVIDWDIAPERVEDRLKFWNELNDYAVSQRGEGARSEYRAVISVHRGNIIYRDKEGFYYGKNGVLTRRCNSAWECQASIDEELSP